MAAKPVSRLDELPFPKAVLSAIRNRNNGVMRVHNDRDDDKREHAVDVTPGWHDTTVFVYDDNGYYAFFVAKNPARVSGRVKFGREHERHLDGLLHYTLSLKRAYGPILHVTHSSNVSTWHMDAATTSAVVRACVAYHLTDMVEFENTFWPNEWRAWKKLGVTHPPSSMVNRQLHIAVTNVQRLVLPPMHVILGQLTGYEFKPLGKEWLIITRPDGRRLTMDDKLSPELLPLFRSRRIHPLGDGDGVPVNTLLEPYGSPIEYDKLKTDNKWRVPSFVEHLFLCYLTRLVVHPNTGAYIEKIQSGHIDLFDTLTLFVAKTIEANPLSAARDMTRYEAVFSDAPPCVTMVRDWTQKIRYQMGTAIGSLKNAAFFEAPLRRFILGMQTPLVGPKKADERRKLTQRIVDDQRKKKPDTFLCKKQSICPIGVGACAAARGLDPSTMTIAKAWATPVKK